MSHPGVNEFAFDYEKSILITPQAGLQCVFYPESVAVIGATDRKGAVGANIMENLIDGLKNSTNKKFEIYPINPKKSEIFGVKAYKKIGDCPVAPQMAVIVLPAKFVPGVVEECGQTGVKALVIISAGFKEVGDEGAALEEECLTIASKYHMRIVGPNCLGVMTPIYGMNATFAARMGLQGSIAFISQSGAMCTAALDWATKQKVGFSAFVSIGSMADVQWSDMLNFLADDVDTKAILIYMETVGDARAFMTAARAITSKKPVIVLKAGKTEAAAEAAASHTGSLAGSHDSYLAAMRACGVLTVDSIRELFDAAVVVQKQPMPKGPKLVIITNAGGPGVLATDATSIFGAEVATLEPETIKELDGFLPAAWSRANPIDVLGDANAECYTKTMQVALKDKNADGVLIILSPQSVTEPLKTAQAVVAAVNEIKSKGDFNKPIICSWMGGVDVEKGFEYLNVNGVPCIDSPDDAAKAFAYLYRQQMYISLANEGTPYSDIPDAMPLNKANAISILKAAQESGQEILSEYDSKMVLKGFGIKITENIVCTSREDAGKAGEVVGYPAVVKLHSDTVTHKSDVGGVMLNVNSAKAIEEAFDKIKENCCKYATAKDFDGVTVQPMLDLSKGIELLAGSVVDPQFGPLVIFGTGGTSVEIYMDTATAIPPLTPNAAKATINATKVAKALHGTGTQRFPGVEMDKLIQTVVNFSNLIAEVTPWVSELEINPLLALPNQMVALDARIVIRDKNVAPEDIPKLIMRPYPTQYRSLMKLKNGTDVTVRPLHVDDAPMLHDMLDEIGSADWNDRFMSNPKAKVLSEVVSMCNADYDILMPLAMFTRDCASLMGVCRGFRLRNLPDTMELKLITSVKYRHIGVSASLIKLMKEVALKEGIKRMICVVGGENANAIKMLEKNGFTKSGYFSNVLGMYTESLEEYRLTL